MTRGVSLAAVLVAVSVQSVSAQGACKDMTRFFAKPPELGRWAEMRMDMQKDHGTKPVNMRVAFVDREQRAGKTFYRMQMTMAHQDGKRQVMQVLTPWGPEMLDGEYDTELVMKMGDQPAVVMPVKGDKAQPGMADLRKHCDKIQFVGEEKVTVPAGTFETRHYAGPDGESWVAPNVPGWRLVRMVTAKGDSMVLTGMGTGEKNSITEKPVDMQSMMGNPEMVKRMMEAQKAEEAK